MVAEQGVKGQLSAAEEVKPEDPASVRNGPPCPRPVIVAAELKIFEQKDVCIQVQNNSEAQKVALKALSRAASTRGGVTLNRKYELTGAAVQYATSKSKNSVRFRSVGPVGKEKPALDSCTVLPKASIPPLNIRW